MTPDNTRLAQGPEMDSIEAEYLRSRAKRRDRALQEELARYEKEDVERAVQEATQPPAAPVVAPQPTKSSPGVVKETAKAVAGGVMDAVAAIGGLWDDSAMALESGYLAAREAFTGQSAKTAVRTANQGPIGTGRVDVQVRSATESMVGQNETTAGKIGRGVVQFAVPFLGTLKAMGAAGAFSQSALSKSMVAGAATDFAAFSAEDGRLTDLVADWAKTSPNAVAPVLQWMADRDPNSPLTERAKTAIEGVFVGAVADAVFRGFRLMKARFWAKGVDPAEEAAKAVAAKKAAEEKAARESLAAREADQVRAAESEAAARTNPQVTKPVIEAQAEKRAAVSARAARESKTAEILAEASRLEKEAADNAAAAKKAAYEEAATAARKADEIPDNPALLDPETVIARRREESLARAADRVLVKETRFAVEEAPNVRALVELLLRKPNALRSADDLSVLRNYADLAREAEERLIADGILPPRAKLEVAVPQRVGTGAVLDDASRIAVRIGSPMPGELASNAVPADRLALAAEMRQAAEETARRAQESLRAIQAAAQKAQVAEARTSVRAAAQEVGGELVSSGGIVIPGTGRARFEGGFASPALLAQIAGSGIGALAGYEMGGTEGAVVGAAAGLVGGAVLKRAIDNAGTAKAAAEAPEKAVSAFKNWMDDHVTTESQHFARDAEGLTGVSSARADPKRTPRISTQQAADLADAIALGDHVAVADAANSWINWDFVRDEQGVQEILLAIEAQFANAANRVGSKSMTEVQIVSLADAMGMSLKTLKTLNEDVAALAPRLYAARTFELASAARFKQMAEAVMDGSSGMEPNAAVLALHRQMHLTATAAAYVKGSVSEVARALRQQQIVATTPREMYQQGLEIVQSLGGLDKNLQELQRLASLELDQLARGVEQSWARRGTDAFLEMYVNGLLSGPVTHTVNALSNMLVAVSGVSEKTMSAAVGAMARSKDRTTLGEVGAQIIGMMAGTRDALRITARGAAALTKATGAGIQGNRAGVQDALAGATDDLGTAWRVFAEDSPIIDVASTGSREQGFQKAITAKNLGIDEDSTFGRGVDLLGTLVRMPGRAMLSADELFKTMHYRGQMHAQAYRAASQKGLKGSEMVEEMARLMHDPTDEMREIALTESRYRTFTTELDGLGATAQQAVLNHPYLRMILPFVRTPVNIMKYSFERLGISPQIWKDLRAGGARREAALGKLSTTAILAMGYAGLAAEGSITGGGEKQRTAEEVANQPRYSVRINGKWYDYSRLEPIGSVLGMMTDSFDIMGGQQDAGERELTAAQVGAIMARNVTSRTYLQGLVDFFDAVASAREDKFEQFIARTMGGAVPFSSAVATATREMDPEMKETRGILDRIQSRIPTLSEEIPPHRDIFMRPVKYRAGLGPDWLSPIRLAAEDSSPAAQEIVRLDVDLQRPSRTIPAGRGLPLELSPQEYDERLKTIGSIRIGGKTLQERLEQLVTSDSYQALPEAPDGPYKGAKQVRIEMIYQQYVKAGTIKFLRDNPSLRERVNGTRRNALNAILGRELVPLPAAGE